MIDETGLDPWTASGWERMLRISRLMYKEGLYFICMSQGYTPKVEKKEEKFSFRLSDAACFQEEQKQILARVAERG
jgi:hypothetical protein